MKVWSPSTCVLCVVVACGASSNTSGNNPGMGGSGSSSSSGSGSTTGSGSGDGSSNVLDGGTLAGCFSIPAVDRVRFYPRAGQAARMKGGKFVGSNMSPTNGFVDIATIASVPPEGQWTELALPGGINYRFVKYYGPAASFGDVAELQFFGGQTAATGTPFGTPSADSMAHTATDAFDGDTTTYYEGGVADNQYVGIDLAGAHVVAPPVFSPPAGRFAAATTVTMSSPTAGATIRYTTDGGDPAQGTVYAGPVSVPATAVLRAVAMRTCMLDSSVAESLYAIGAASKTAQATLHLGNSLSAIIVSSFPAMAKVGNFQLAFNYCASPGVGVDALYATPQPACANVGAGAITNIKDTLSKVPFDQIILQPFPFTPCTPYGPKGDSAFVNDFYKLAKAKNAAVQNWVYMTWPEPVAKSWPAADCFAGGSPPNISPAWKTPAVPTDWESATMNHLAYVETVRSGVDALNAGGKPTLIIPTGLGLVKLKHAVEAGQVHDVATTAFFATIFGSNGTDLHTTPAGSYFDAAMFYSCLFQKSPEGLKVDTSLGITAAEGADFQHVAWQTALNYKWSGLQ